MSGCGTRGAEFGISFNKITLIWLEGTVGGIHSLGFLQIPSRVASLGGTDSDRKRRFCRSLAAVRRVMGGGQRGCTVEGRLKYGNDHG